jgi:hypothetical protein
MLFASLCGCCETRLAILAPLGESPTTESFACEWSGMNQGLASGRAVLAQVETMNEVSVRPGQVRLEERRTDSNGSWVVGRFGRINDSYDCFIERLVEDGKVRGVASDTDQRFKFGELGEIVEQDVRKVVWVGEIASIVRER